MEINDAKIAELKAHWTKLTGKIGLMRLMPIMHSISSTHYLWKLLSQSCLKGPKQLTTIKLLETLG